MARKLSLETVLEILIHRITQYELRLTLSQVEIYGNSELKILYKTVK